MVTEFIIVAILLIICIIFLIKNHVKSLNKSDLIVKLLKDLLDKSNQGKDFIKMTERIDQSEDFIPDQYYDQYRKIKADLQNKIDLYYPNEIPSPTPLPENAQSPGENDKIIV